MEFRILGPLEVVHAGADLHVGGPRHRALLAALLVHGNEVVPTGRLIHALWGDEPPKSAVSMLHVRVSELRKALRVARPDRHAGLLTRGSGYVLEVGPDEVDAHRFERLAAAGRQALARGDHEGASAGLGAALSLWRGDPLVEFAELGFARGETARLNALRLQALEDRVAADLALGRHDELVVELQTLVADHPMRERFWRQLILALYRAGRQGEALEAYRAVRELLVERLGIDPGAELQRLHGAVLRQDPALDLGGGGSGRPSREAPPASLPVRLTSFIGREWELAEVRALLQTSRLVTLTGVGGVGKSRLAIEVAAACGADHVDGTRLVELAALTQPGLVVHVLAATLGVREHPERPIRELIAERLREAEVLLILDNCEHLVAEVAALAQWLLEACGRLRILATSRERLGITVEVLRPVSGLTPPDHGATTAKAVGRADAARLFTERAAAVQPGFRLCDATAAAVAQICHRLDGLPLAIELAAARANAVGVEEIAARLDDRFRLLSHGSRTALARHQTLRAVVDWSYELLRDSERALFDRLSVFVGGFTLEAAEVVCADPGSAEAVAAQVARLVDKSLLVTEPGGAGTRRYRLLETLRAYGLERLAESGGTERLGDRHAAFFLALAEPAAQAMRGPEQAAWVDRLETEHGNIRTALEWSLARGDAATAVRLAGSLYQLWDLHGHYTEGRRWLARVLAADGDVPPAARARALISSAGLAVIQGDLRQAATFCEEAVALCERAEDRAGLAQALQYLGLVAIYAEEFDRAASLLEESLRCARSAGERWAEGWSLLFLATAAAARGEHARAAVLSTECEAVLRPVGDPEGLAWALVIGGGAAWRVGDHLTAAGRLRDGILAFRGLGGLWGLSLGLSLAAHLAGACGDHERMTALLGASEHLRASVGAAVLPFVRVWHEAAVAQAMATLGPESFGAAWQRGQALSLDAAVTEGVRQLDLVSRPLPVKG